MAGMTTVLTGFSENGNSRTYTVTGHTTAKPKLVIQKRKIPANADASGEITLAVTYATVDADDLILTGKVAFEASIRYPVQGQDTDVAAALVVFRDLVASDEFTSMVSTLNWIDG